VQGPLAGASDAWASAPEPTSSAASPPRAPRPTRGAWDGYGEVSRLATVSPTPFTSRGHLPEQQVDIRVNDVARANYLATVTDSVFPDGSLVAELSRSANGKGYVMRKSAGVWSYFELGPQGVLLEGGTRAFCAGCHAQAPSDHVFGLPRPP
jgi:hypothetical protein